MKEGQEDGDSERQEGEGGDRKKVTAGDSGKGGNRTSMIAGQTAGRRTVSET